MDLLWIILGAILAPVFFFLGNCVFRLSRYYLRYRLNKHKYNKLPKHPNGNVNLAISNYASKDYLEMMPQFMDKATGELFDLVDIGPSITGQQTVAVMDADLAGKIFSSTDATEYPKPELYDMVAELLLGNGLVTAKGAHWRSHRTMISPLFHFQSLKQMFDMMVVYTNDLVQELKQNGSDKEFKLLSSVLSKFTLSQIIYLAFGGTLDIDWMHKRQVRIGELFPKCAALEIFFGPLIRYVPFTSAWDLTVLRREVEAEVRQVLAQARKEAAAGTLNTQTASMLNTMLNPKNGQTVTDQEIIDEATTFLFAGFDTTSVTLSWVLYLLATHPDELRWVQKEIDQVLGAPKSPRSPTLEDLPKLKRTRAVVNEALRLRPPAFVVPRCTIKEMQLGPYTIPAGTNVEINVFMMQRNPKYFPNPHAFYPQRWLSDEAPADNETEGASHPFAYVPFSAGMRNCVGKNFAIQEMLVAASILLSHFEMEVDSSRPVEVRGTPVQLPIAYVKFHPRAK